MSQSLLWIAGAFAYAAGGVITVQLLRRWNPVPHDYFLYWLAFPMWPVVAYCIVKDRLWRFGGK